MVFNNVKLSSFSCLIPVILMGCAGPSTPLGAVWTVMPAKVNDRVQAGMARSPSGQTLSAQAGQVSTQASAKIFFTPRRQSLHGPAPINVEIYDPKGDMDINAVSVFHNGVDVTTSLMRQASSQIKADERKLYINVPVVRLPAAEDNVIEFAYRGQSGAFGYARFPEPECRAFRFQSISNTGEFNPPSSTLKIIAEAAGKEGFNPAFLTALIAQESGFNPRVVSWSKAIGLTQVTTLAEQQVIVQSFPEWPRYPKVDELPVPWLRTLVLMRKINPENEWRLNVEKSIQGGLAFAHYLADKWSSPDNIELIRKTFPDPEAAHTELVLASYNSGYARVYGSLKKNGKNWLRTSEMKGTRKYVNRILSYCYHFSDV